METPTEITDQELGIVLEVCAEAFSGEALSISAAVIAKVSGQWLDTTVKLLGWNQASEKWNVEAGDGEVLVADQVADANEVKRVCFVLKRLFVPVSARYGSLEAQITRANDLSAVAKKRIASERP